MGRTGKQKPKKQKITGKSMSSRTLAYRAVAVLILGIGLYFLIAHLVEANPSDSDHQGVPTVAIVDQLGLSQPNDAFIRECTMLLNNSGFAVDYYDGESVTVGFYKDLPEKDYKIILLRVHSASFNPEQEVFDLFTSERYRNNKYISDQMNDRIRPVAFEPYEQGDPVYFGVTAKFIRSSTKGSFDKSIIVMMGCEGMKYSDMPEAFIKKGAEIYIGWDDLVSAQHTDEVTLELLRQFLMEGQTIEDAVAETMYELGADPAFQFSAPNNRIEPSANPI